MDRINDSQYSSARTTETVSSVGNASIQDIVAVVWQRRRYAFIGGAIGLVAAGLFATTMAPKYVSKATMLVDLRELEVSNTGLTPAVPAQVLETLVNSEESLLYSSRVLGKVVIENDLQDNAEFTGRGALGQVKNSIKAMLGLGQKPVDLHAVAIKALQERLEVERKEDTVILTVAVSTEEPQLSQKINQSVLNTYFEIRNQNSRESADRVVSGMESKLDELVNRVTQAEGAVEQYKIKNNILDTDGRLNNEQQVNTITDQLSSAQLETARLQSRYDQYRDVIRSGNSDGGASGVFQSPVMATLRTRLLEAQDQQAALKVSHGQIHPRMVEINQRVTSLKKAIRGEAQKDLKAAQQELSRATELENALQQELAGLQRKAGNINQSLVPLRDLERKAEAARSVYVSTLTRIREISAQQNVDKSNVRIVSDPTLPTKNARISKSLLAMLGGLFGMSLGAFVGLVTRPNGKSLAPPRDDISTTGLPVLVKIPVSHGVIKPPLRSGDIWAGPKLYGLPENSATSAFSVEELYGQLRDTGRVPANDGQYTKTILLLGVDSDVSTSVFAANFAALGDRDHRRLLLVDGVSSTNGFQGADLPRSEPDFHSKTPQESMLTKLSRLNGNLQKHEGNGAISVECLLTASKDPTRPRSDESVVNRIMGLSADYDMIIMDGGQLHSQQHLRSFSHLASEIVLVVQQRESMLDALDEAHELLNDARDKVVGCIFLSSDVGERRSSEILERRDLQLRISSPAGGKDQYRSRRISNEYR